MKKKIKDELYCKYVEARLPERKFFPSVLYSFLIGGIICCLGQGISDLLMWGFPEITKEVAQVYMLIILIFIASFLTGIGVFDRIALIAGAGTIVPITGFSNSIASPAIEFKNEGIIFGLCVKMFSIAGPVIVCGIVSSVAVGLIYWVVGLF